MNKRNRYDKVFEAQAVKKTLAPGKTKFAASLFWPETRRITGCALTENRSSVLVWKWARRRIRRLRTANGQLFAPKN